AKLRVQVAFTAGETGETRIPDQAGIAIAFAAIGRRRRSPAQLRVEVTLTARGQPALGGPRPGHRPPYCAGRRAQGFAGQRSRQGWRNRRPIQRSKPPKHIYMAACIRRQYSACGQTRGSDRPQRAPAAADSLRGERARQPKVRRADDRSWKGEDRGDHATTNRIPPCGRLPPEPTLLSVSTYQVCPSPSALVVRSAAYGALAQTASHSSPRAIAASLLAVRPHPITASSKKYSPLCHCCMVVNGLAPAPPVPLPATCVATFKSPWPPLLSLS